MQFVSPVTPEGIDGGSVSVALGGEQVHRGFEIELLRGLVEYNWVQHDVVQVMRDIALEGFQVRLRVVIMLLQGDGFNTFAILSERSARKLRCGRAMWARGWRVSEALCSNTRCNSSGGKGGWVVPGSAFSRSDDSSQSSRESESESRAWLSGTS